MIRIAHIQDGHIVNVSLRQSAEDLPPGLMLESEALAAGYTWQREQEARKIWPSAAAFWQEFTDSEQLDIITATIAPIKLLDRQLIMWQGEVWSDDERVQQGLAGLVAAGILTEERKQTILAQ